MVTDENTFVYISIGEPDTLIPLTLTIQPAARFYQFMTIFSTMSWRFKQAGTDLATEVPTIDNGLISDDGRTITVPIRKV